jgi:hypothetical protein
MLASFRFCLHLADAHRAKPGVNSGEHTTRPERRPEQSARCRFLVLFGSGLSILRHVWNLTPRFSAPSITDWMRKSTSCVDVLVTADNTLLRQLGLDCFPRQSPSAENFVEKFDRERNIITRCGRDHNLHFSPIRSFRSTALVQVEQERGECPFYRLPQKKWK